MKIFYQFLILTTYTQVVSTAFAEQPASSEKLWTLSPAISFSHQKEQTRDASGNSSGVISASRHFALMMDGTYSLLPFLDAGVFFLAERGARTIISGPVVDYTLFWTGPMVRAKWKFLFFEVAYVLYGTRMDRGLPTVTSSTGDNSSSFKTDPSRAWLLAPGVSFALSECLDGFVKVEYRFHYYNRRGEDELAGNAVIGSQAVRPHLGIRWSI